MNFSNKSFSQFSLSICLASLILSPCLASDTNLGEIKLPSFITNYIDPNDLALHSQSPSTAEIDFTKTTNNQSKKKTLSEDLEKLDKELKDLLEIDNTLPSSLVTANETENESDIEKEIQKAELNINKDFTDIESNSTNNFNNGFADALFIDSSLSGAEQSMLVPVRLDANGDRILDLSLEKALSLAAKFNLNQKAIRQTVNRDKWRFTNSFSRLLPDASFDYNVIDRGGGSSFSSSAGTNINRGSNFLATFGIRETLSLPNIFGTVASYHDWMSTEQFLDATNQELLRQTANQYYEVMRSRSELAVRIEAYKKAKENLELNDELLAGGVGTKFSVIQARTQLSENKLALLAQQATARIAEIQLLALLNYPLETNLKLQENSISRNELISSSDSIESLVDFALNNRPDIKRRYMALKASNSRVWQAGSELAPTLNASYTTSSNTTNLGSSLSPGKIDDFTTAAVGVNWTLRGMALGQASSIFIQKSERGQVNFELQQEILQAELQVRDAYLRSQSAKQQIDAADEQVQAAVEGLELARIRLKSGVGTNIDLIDSQRTYVNAWINKVRATIQYNQAQVDLLRYIGNINVPRLVTFQK